MKLYLSSFRTGTETNKLQEITKHGNKRVAFIPNALDYFEDVEERSKFEQNDMEDLKVLGFHVDRLDLTQYFNKKNELKKIIDSYHMIWVCGGNTFVIRQAMHLSGLDDILRDLYTNEADFVYGGFSAGICVLAPTLEGIDLVDPPNIHVYGEEHETIWEGLGLTEYTLVPHYRSPHFESAEVEDVVQYMIDHKRLFIALRDGEVIVIG